jgi:hypothetical protein
MGTVTVTLRKKHVGVGASVVVTADLALSGAYSAGGDTLTLKSLGLDSCYWAEVNGVGPAAQLYRVVFGATDNADLKLQAFVSTTGVEVSGNQAAATCRIAAHGNYSGA